jgi:outer membrane protein assembly factor BamD (BamD/ComL family)
MEEFETLFKSLEREGLCEGKILFEQTEYLYREGLFSVKPISAVKGLSRTERERHVLEIKDKHAWQEAQLIDTIEGYEEYLDKYPEGESVKSAQERIGILKKDLKAWEQAQTIDTVQVYELYTGEYPDGRYVAEANDRVTFLKKAAAAWQKTQEVNSMEVYQQFIKNYPGCKAAADAAEFLKILAEEEKTWAETGKANTIEAYHAYLKSYPTGKGAAEAFKRIAFLEEEKRKEEQRLQEDEKAWEKAEKRDTISSYTAYIGRYPHGQFTERAGQRINALENDQKAWESSTHMNTITSYRRYIKKYPQGKFHDIALKNLEVLKNQEQQAKLNKAAEKKAWKSARQSNTIDSYREYLDRYPEGRYAKAAQKGIEKLEAPPKTAAENKPGERWIFNTAAAVSVIIVIVIVILIIIFNYGKKQKTDTKVPNPPAGVQETNGSSTGNPIETSDEKLGSIIPSQPTNKKNEGLLPEAPKKAHEIEYSKNMENARQAYAHGRLFDALSYVKKAREAKDTGEAYNLEQEIHARLKATLPRVTFIDLLPSLSTTYAKALQSIKFPPVEPGTEIAGQICVTLEIDHKGKISLQNFDDFYLKVEPESRKVNIKKRISKKFTSMALPVPKNNDEDPVILVGWKLTYTIKKNNGTYKLEILY